MTGKDSAPSAAPGAPRARPHTTERLGWLDRLASRRQRYLPIDGGAGAQLFAALAGQSPLVREVASPRHADLLIIAEPLSAQLAPALATLARSVPQPARVLLVGAGGASASPEARALFPDAPRVPGEIQAILAALTAPARLPRLRLSDAAPADESPTISLPPKREREIATELAVLSLGPLQPFTAGPLRLWLICDGEQVLSCQVDAGYAARNIAGRMRESAWQDAAALAATLDPLAPVASRLAYVRALEALQRWQLPTRVAEAREAALAVERAENALWWCVRFFRLLKAPMLIAHTFPLATRLAAAGARLWPTLPPSAWLLPQGDAPTVEASAVEALHGLAADIEHLARALSRQRLPQLRTREVGQLSAQRLTEAGVSSGPVLTASQSGAGDIQSRLLARLRMAATALREIAPGARDAARGPARTPTESGAPSWDVPAGEAEGAAEGPRGRLAVRVRSEGGTRPTEITWQRPSATLLPLLPEVLRGQKVADAEMIVASLDLAMAEADG
ncbi:MAG: hypothetical protein IVW57_13815 [Ktedonobacterales bacterium]|nr:hypothetical protein [Ktedonobacterales bacterium]